MSDPSTPPVPPAPSPAQPQPAPRYGEFAPVETPAAGSVPPAEPAAPAYPPQDVAAPAAQQVPGYPAAQSYPPAPQASPAAQGYPPAQPAPQQGYPAAYPAQQQQPGYPAPSAQPGYPGYSGAVPAPGYGQPVYGQPGFAGTPVRRRRTWDVVLTIVLLALGLLGTLGGVMYGVIFSSPELIDEVFRQQGLGGFDGEIGAGPMILIVSHVLLYLAAIGLSILLLVKKKLAFYVPLTAGVVAAIIFWVTLTSIMMSDPDFMNRYS